MERIIIDHEDVLKMLDKWMEKRDGEWWDHFYQDHMRPIPFFSNVPDISLVKWLDASKITPGRSLDIGCGNGRNTLYLRCRAGRQQESISQMRLSPGPNS